MRTMVSESLRAIISQRLVPRPTADGGCRALEILVVNKAVGNLIRENKTFQIRSVLQTGARAGHVPARRLARRPGEERGHHPRGGRARHAEDPRAVRRGTTSWRRIDELFQLPARTTSGSDLHLAAGPGAAHPRRTASLEAVAGLAGADRTTSCARSCARSRASAQWDGVRGAAATSTSPTASKGVARFRANYLRQENGAGAVFRIIPEQIVPLEKLNLPKAIERFAHLAAGARAGHRPHRLGQVDDARGDHRPHQHDLRQAHRHHRGPGRVRAPEQAVDLLPARGGHRHRELRRRAARRHPPGRRT